MEVKAEKKWRTQLVVWLLREAEMYSTLSGHKAVAAEIKAIIDKYDWDGVCPSILTTSASSSGLGGNQ